MLVNHFFDMIQRLREQEEIILYDSILQTSETDEKQVLTFLETEYQRESLGYPYEAPSFNGQAALWGAKTIYTAAQLMLIREHREADLSLLLQNLTATPTPSEILSADLCLRFLPDLLQQLKLFDTADALIPILENILTHWHFSGIHYPLDQEKMDFQQSISNSCLHQLYTDRIITGKNMGLAKHPAFESRIAASLGMHARELWKEFKTEIL